MRMPDTDPDTEFPGVVNALPLEVAPGVDSSASTVTPTGLRHSLWATLVSYFAPAESPRFAALWHEGIQRWDEEDFSAEHGYEPGFEGRSEFEHGEFDRWL